VPARRQPGALVQFCRCQNGADSMSVTSEVSGSGGVAHVTLHWGTTNMSTPTADQVEADLRASPLTWKPRSSR
jgi:hypothetical protein